METWGFFVIIVGLVIYLIARKRSQGWRGLGIWLFGIGIGILIGTYGAFFIALRQSLLP